MEVTKKKRSFWQILTCQPAETEVSFYNPLNIGIGKVVNINYPGYEGLDFRIESVLEYTRRLNGREYLSTAYDIVAKPIAQTPVRARLFALPVKGATAEDAYSYSLLLLKVNYEQEWDDSFTPVLEEACENKKWVVEDDGTDDDGKQVSAPYRDEYFRLNDLSDPYIAEVAEIEDENGDGKFDEDETRTHYLTYYDFAREVEDAPGAQSTEFYIVEKDGQLEEEGYLTMWKGDEIDPSRVTVL